MAMKKPMAKKGTHKMPNGKTMKNSSMKETYKSPAAKKKHEKMETPKKKKMEKKMGGSS